MQIRKCVLIEMFSLVLIGMFSPFFHIIGSRIGAFGLFPFLDAVCLFNFGGTHTSVRQNAARTHGPGCAERAVPHGWTRAERISRPTAQAQDRTGPRQPGERRRRSCGPREGRRRRGRPPGGGAGATTGHRRVPGGAARPRPRLNATACTRRARRARRVRAARPRWGRRTLRRSGRGGAAGARAMSAARATSSARVIMHVGSPDAARAQDVASRWSRRARSWRRACRDGRSHRGRGARPHDRARRDKRDGQRDGVEPRGRRHRG